MKKLVKIATACAAAGLLFCGGVYAQDQDIQNEPTGSTMSVESAGPSSKTVTVERNGQPGRTVTVERNGQPGRTVTVERVGHPGYGGYNVCYFPVHRHVQATRIVRRCGQHGFCRDVQVTRDFYVRVNTDCHIKVGPCLRGGARYGSYPNKFDARHALNRCERSINGEIPPGWHVRY